MTLAQRLLQADVSGLSDPAAADILNTPNAANGFTLIDVPSIDLYSALLGTGEWGKLEWASRLAPTGTLASPSVQDVNVMAAITFVRAAQNAGALRLSDPVVAAAYTTLSQTLVSAGLISSNTRTVVLAALSVRNLSWAQANGFPNGVTARDIGLARGSR